MIPPRRLALVLVMVLIFSGCAKHRFATDLVTYVNRDILGIAQVEEAALARYAAAVGPNYTTDEAVVAALDETIPLYGRFLTLLRKIPTPDDRIRDLHARYVRGAGLMDDGFRAKREGILKQDPQGIAAANDRIEAGRVETEQWQTELLALYDTYRIRTGDPGILKLIR